MTVFRGYLKVVRSNWPTICLYLGIFIACTILFQFTAQSTDEETYQMSGMNIGVTDGDGGELAGALIAYLGSIHHVTELEDEISVLQEKFYYRDVDYILRIPDDFYEECVSGGKKLEVTSIPGSYSGIYVEQQIGSFLNNAAVYQEAGFTETEAARALEQREAVRVELADYGNSSADEAGYSYYFRYMPYLYLAVFGFVLGDILWIFGRKDLNRRMMASPCAGKKAETGGNAVHGSFRRRSLDHSYHGRGGILRKRMAEKLQSGILYSQHTGASDLLSGPFFSGGYSFS